MSDILISLRKKRHLSLLLIMIVSSIGMLGITQESATTVAWSDKTGASPQKYRDISAGAIRDPTNLLNDSLASDEDLLWKLHLALELVKHPELNKRQVRIILDAISFSSPEFFAASSYSPPRKTKADETLELLKRRAARAFPKGKIPAFFANMTIGKTEADILRMYFDISALPLKSRKASFRSASPNDKSNLWKTHLALFLAKRSDLNELQKAVILSAISLATPEYFGVRSSDPAWKTKVREVSRGLEQQIVSAFALEDAALIFATLGDDTVSAKSASALLKNIEYKPISDAESYKQWSHSRLVKQDPVIDQTCSCSTQSDYCPMLSYCNGGGCSSTESGCGTLWNHPCNGTCR